jgi:hypothetical protein
VHAVGDLPYRRAGEAQEQHALLGLQRVHCLGGLVQGDMSPRRGRSTTAWDHHLTKPQRDLLAKLDIPTPKQVNDLQPAPR